MRADDYAAALQRDYQAALTQYAGDPESAALRRITEASNEAAQWVGPKQRRKK